MSDLSQLYQSIILDPCNQGAERRNWAKIRDAFEEVEDTINNIINNDGGDNIGIGDVLVFFECTATQIGSATCPVKRLVWNGSSWDPTGEDFVAYDWSTNGQFKQNFVSGNQGIGVIREGIATDALLIVTLEGYARFVEGTLNGPFSGSSASAAVDSYWGAYPNVADPGATVTVHDRANQSNGLDSGDKIIAVLDEQSQQYVLLTNKVDTEEDPPGSAGECAVVKIDSGVMSCVDVTYNGFCVWSGKTQAIVGGATMCGSPWSDGSDIWILDMRACSITGRAPTGERFLAYSTGISYEPAGLGARPLYAIKTDQEGSEGTSSDFAVIRISQAGVESCDVVEAGSDCLYSANLQVAGGGPSACNLWSNGAEVWAVATNQCTFAGNGALAGDIYIAVKISESFGPSGDQRPLYAFRIEEMNRTAVVQITGESEDCEEEEYQNTCTWDAVIVDINGEAEDNLCEAFAATEDEVFVVQVNRCDKSETVRVGERYIGVAIGQFNGKAAFAIQTNMRNEALVRWGRCASNWYNTESACDYVIIQELESCDSEETIEPDADDPNYEEAAPIEGGQSVDGYKVYLPHTPPPAGGHPNLIVGDVIGYTKTRNGKYVCVTDYMDAPIGTIQMQIGETCERKGWALMDGDKNKDTEGGSGYDMQTYFPRMPSRDTEDTYGWVGETGGRTCLAEEELEHVHYSEETQGLCFGLDPNMIIEESDSKYYPKCYVCMKDSTWERYEGRTTDCLLPGYGQWGDGTVTGGAAIPIEDPCFPTGDEEAIPWGPINITPKYRNVMFIERIDNSQDYNQ